jgi:hypothetical protein
MGNRHIICPTCQGTGQSRPQTQRIRRRNFLWTARVAAEQGHIAGAPKDFRAPRFTSSMAAARRKRYGMGRVIGRPRTGLPCRLKLDAPRPNLDGPELKRSAANGPMGFHSWRKSFRATTLILLMNWSRDLRYPQVDPQGEPDFGQRAIAPRCAAKCWTSPHRGYGGPERHTTSSGESTQAVVSLVSIWMVACAMANRRLSSS